MYLRSSLTDTLSALQRARLTRLCIALSSPYVRNVPVEDGREVWFRAVLPDDALRFMSLTKTCYVPRYNPTSPHSIAQGVFASTAYLSRPETLDSCHKLMATLRYSNLIRQGRPEEEVLQFELIEAITSKVIEAGGISLCLDAPRAHTIKPGRRLRSNSDLLHSNRRCKNTFATGCT